MRALIFVIVVIILAVIAALATGLLHVSPHRGGKASQPSATGNAVTGTSGQPRAFDVETGSAKVGTKETTVKTPTLEVQKAGQSQAATNNAM